MSSRLTTSQLARTLGVTIARVHQLARNRGVTPTMIAGRCLWPPEAIDRLRPRASGWHGQARNAAPTTGPGAASAARAVQKSEKRLNSHSPRRRYKADDTQLPPPGP